MSDKIIVYGNLTCPEVPKARAILRRAGAEVEYINISFDGDAKTRVKDINDGYASVPTLVFPDGTTLTEPGSEKLVEKLESLGYAATPLTSQDEVVIALRNPMLALFGAIALVVGVLSSTVWLLTAGLVILAVSLLALIVSRNV